MRRYTAILSALYDEAHLILPSKLAEIEAFVRARAAGEATIAVEAEQPKVYCVDAAGEPVAMDRLPAGQSNQFVAVLPLFGTMFQHGGIEMAASGGTSTEQFGEQLQRLDNNPAVKTILIEAHSPGGQVFGTEELSNLIHRVRERGRTRVVAVANSMAASAALWTTTAAHELHVTPGGQVGSIGVATFHQDVSAAQERRGVKTTLMAIPERKIEGHEFAPLSEEVQGRIMSKIESTYRRFVSAVARNRNVSTEKVESDFGGGDMLRADEAVEAGLADSVSTKAEVLADEVSRLRAGGRNNQNALRIAQLDD